MTHAAFWLSLIVGLGLTACSATERYRQGSVTEPHGEEMPPQNPLESGPPPLVEPEPATLAELLAGIEAAYRKGDYDRGLRLVKRVFELGSTDVTALDRVGSIYYVLGRYGEALTIWQQALPLEKNLRRRRELSKSIVVARRTLGLEADSTAQTTPPPSAAPRPRPQAQVLRPPDRKEIDALYRKGVKHYARGEFLQATTAFLRILEIDPKNQRAGKALERLHLEGAAAER